MFPREKHMLAAIIHRDEYSLSGLGMRFQYNDHCDNVGRPDPYSDYFWLFHFPTDGNGDIFEILMRLMSFKTILAASAKT